MEEESGSVILLYCYQDLTMQDACRGTGQESPPQHRETEEGFRETALGPAAMSTEVTPRRVNLDVCSPALWPLPTTGCLLQLDRQLSAHQLAVYAAAHSRRMVSTLSCDTYQVPATALCYQGVTSHSRRRGVGEVCGV